ncbi:RNA 2',3'-cyclic phosphodiesterase [Cohnella caldifontis]|uniref:RNA 2',3'-cyclic phosphodiesterase n=1 Tax=Cohnella caldifontis TaxID=3027471 RepID=UPI0023ED17E3|nr:RNA 2',3'-cyclic phosphodiesterase [Cohnella sp. YIM B05605]
MNNLRLFIGISPSNAVAEALREAIDRMAARLPFRKWTHPDDLHVTLHFLGDTPETRLEAIKEALLQTATSAAPFTLSLTAPGTFGPPSAPRVLWLGLAEPGNPGALARLHQALAPGLQAAGCTLEDRPFRAHVTLARQGGPECGREAVQAAWEEYRTRISADLLEWTADRVTLFRSHLGRRPSYERIGQYPFGHGPSGAAHS